MENTGRGTLAVTVLFICLVSRSYAQGPAVCRKGLEEAARECYGIIRQFEATSYAAPRVALISASLLRSRFVWAGVIASFGISCAAKLQGNALADGVFSTVLSNSMKTKTVEASPGPVLWLRNCSLKRVSLL